jgi:tetratricopeptide (TPR) repeat protein
MDEQRLLEHALSLADEGDWEGMAAWLREHLGEHGDAPAVLCWLGVAERELGLEGMAYERFRKALSLGPEDPYVLATAGNGVAAFDDPDAEQALRTAALIAPDLPVTRYLYGAYLAREGFVSEGRAELEAARGLDPEDAPIAFELGVARFLAGDVDGATDAMGDSVRLDPYDGWARVLLGLILLEADRLDEALAELHQGARLRPDDVSAQALTSLLAAATGAEETAYEMLERGRIRAGDADRSLLALVEERVDSGPEAARALLVNELAPDELRQRLRVRP